MMFCGQRSGSLGHCLLCLSVAVTVAEGPGSRAQDHDLEAGISPLNGGAEGGGSLPPAGSLGEAMPGGDWPVASDGFDARRRAALEEVADITRGLTERSERGEGAGGAASRSPGEDYLPCIAGLLGRGTPDATAPARDDAAAARWTPLAGWLKALDESDGSGRLVYGFIEPSLVAGCRFVAANGSEIPVDHGWDRPADQNAAADHRAAELTVVVPPELIVPFRQTLAGQQAMVAAARDQRLAAEARARRPAAAYRWIFGQLFSQDAEAYVPFRRVWPVSPRMLIAVAGKARREEGVPTVEVQRLLAATTPLASQATWIGEHKGLPAVLVDAEGAHETVFVRCPVFSASRQAWLAERPALDRVTAEPDAYLRSLLTASRADIDAMNQQLRDEIESCTTRAMERAFAEPAVAEGLLAVGVDEQRLDAYQRLFVSGLGRKIAEQLQALSAGQVIPGDAIRAVEEDRRRFSKLARDPWIEAFVDAHFMESFLVLAVDQEGVSLCDLRALLDLHRRYAVTCVSERAEDPLADACRFAEIGVWLRASNALARMPRDPPFMPLPATPQAKRKILAQLTASGSSEQVPPPAAVDEAGGERAEESGSEVFELPGG